MAHRTLPAYVSHLLLLLAGPAGHYLVPVIPPFTLVFIPGQDKGHPLSILICSPSLSLLPDQTPWDPGHPSVATGSEAVSLHRKHSGVTSLAPLIRSVSACLPHTCASADLLTFWSWNVNMHMERKNPVCEKH